MIPRTQHRKMREGRVTDEELDTIKKNLIEASDDVRNAIAGVRYKLPIGPIRLDYGFNPDPHEDEDFGAFHFSFGFAF